MNDDELIDILEDAGLSPYQSEAYVTLLDLGTASATDVAEACDVPDPRIYDVLRDLESEGYVETFKQDSLTARARDPSTVLEDLRSRSNRYLTAAEEIEERWNDPAVEDHEVSVVKRFDTVLKRARELIATAEHQVQIGADVAQFRALEPDLAEAHERGVNVKLSLCTAGVDEADVPTADELAGVCTEARERTIPSPFLAVGDRTWTCFVPHHRSDNEYGVLVDDRTHTYVFHWFFITCLWENWDTIYTERSSDPPISYVDLRHCARDLVPLFEDVATVELAVEGYDMNTGERIEHRGEVVTIDYTGDDARADDRLPLSRLAGRLSVTLDTGEDTVEIGGWGAVIEDVEATNLTVTDVSRD